MPAIQVHEHLTLEIEIAILGSQRNCITGVVDDIQSHFVCCLVWKHLQGKHAGITNDIIGQLCDRMRTQQPPPFFLRFGCILGLSAARQQAEASCQFEEQRGEMAEGFHGGGERHESEIPA
ncbi:MAG: hypothetical protein JNM99_09435 [Verrucomicrobiaceae bacterium]|nr:hypothetical protein [Verrucomicrobiaceae bacterium]